MCQLIAVTWLIWKLSADQLIVLLDRHQCSISYFLASLRAQKNWKCTHIARQCCDQLTAVKTGYPLTTMIWPIACSGVDPSRSSIFFKLTADKLLVFKWSKTQEVQRLLQSWFKTTNIVFFYNNISAGHTSLLQVYRCYWTYVAITILCKWRMSQ